MTPISSFETLAYTAAGAVLWWVGSVLKNWLKTSTSARRAATDKVAALEIKNRMLTESLYDHRNQMLKSGYWTRETLPPFTKE